MDEGRGWVGEGITKLKPNEISAAVERKQCLLHGETCLAACSICVGAAFPNDLAPGKRSEENVMDCIWKLVSIDVGV